MKHDQELSLHRNSSSSRSTRKILPSNYVRSSATLRSNAGETSEKPIVKTSTFVPFPRPNKIRNIVTILRSLLNIFSIPTFIPTCGWLTIPTRLSISPSLGRKVTGTLFGHKKGHVSFVVQDDPRSEPVLVLELATSTSNLVKEMASGLVRIALECERGSGSGRPVKLFQEPMWSMYCNGRKCGYAVTRSCGEFDWRVLSTVQTVSVGAGVIPVDKDRSCSGSEGDLMYMRARFERVVGNRDSEAFYMMNPDGNGGPELSIFLLRI
ncbi:hypothetical protein HHK36_019768 [Tetracentron sinense]|uniref:Protein MIZU-KUSSEI 1 n=1 Tax=Tetracentron sinense TaxID=13715 RepID=A0A834YU82_TETSI|nr:hypothetical protein HHK36_019768 [Tetracentron sinense]